MLTQTNLRMVKEKEESHRVPAYEEGGARPREDTSQGGACLPDSRGDTGHLWLSRQKIYIQGPRPALLVDDALYRG